MERTGGEYGVRGGGGHSVVAAPANCWLQLEPQLVAIPTEPSHVWLKLPF